MIDLERERRRLRLASLVSEYFGNDNDVIASVICQITSKQVTVRSIQTWLTPQDRQSSRNTPEWAIRALEDYVNRPGNAAMLKDMVAQSSAHNAGRTKSLWDRGHEIRSNNAVELAEDELQAELRDRQGWIDLLGKGAGEAVHQRFSAMQREIEAQSRRTEILWQALELWCPSDDARARLKAAAMGEAVGQSAIRSAKEALKAGTEEFSNDEGVAPGKRA